jgi:hypothetical protein
MTEMLIGGVLGVVLVSVCWGFQTWGNRTKYTVQQNKDWADIQGKVEEIVTILERIVHRPRN